MDSTEVLDRLQAAGLGHRIAELAPLMLRAVRMALQVSEEQRLPVGSSKVGGMCDLPASIPWPAWRGESLTAVAQVNLAEVASVAGATALPTSGMLYFFYEVSLDKWIDFPDEREGWRVLYYDGDVSTLARVGPPMLGPDRTAFRPHEVTFTPAVTLPPPDSLDMAQLGLDAGEIKRYEAVEREVNAFGHQLLGHPHEVQFDMQRERALAARGLSWPAFSGLPKHEQVAILADARQWQLIYQAEDITAEGPYGHLGSTWGDAGQLYYWIRTDALGARDFSQTAAVMQSC